MRKKDKPSTKHREHITLKELLDLERKPTQNPIKHDHR